jgi:hypothetical protein
VQRAVGGAGPERLAVVRRCGDRMADGRAQRRALVGPQALGGPRVALGQRAGEYAQTLHGSGGGAHSVTPSVAATKSSS